MDREIFSPKNSSFDRDSDIPLYLQLKNFLLAKINNEVLVEGEMLPSELEFQKATGLSRATIRQALNELENEEFIKRQRGVGTIVSKRKLISQVMKLTSFSEDMNKRGFSPSSKTVSLEFTYPPPKVIELSNFNPLERIWVVRRVRLANDIPVGIHDLYLPPSLQISPRELENMVSFYDLLTNVLKIPPVRATESISATSVTKKEASLLQMRVSAPVLVIWRVAYSEADEVVEVCRMLHDAERYEYKAQLFRE